MEATAASERNNLWTRFNVQIVGWVQYIIVSFSMIMAFSVVPLYIETLPLPWRIYAVVIWAFNQPVFHAIWLSFLPPRIPPSYPTFAAQIILLVSWLWSIASIRESLGLNDSVAVVVGVLVYVAVVDPLFRGVLMMTGVDRYLTEWSILQAVRRIMELAARNLSARFTVRASPPGSTTEEDAPELEGGLLGVEDCKIPPPYSYKYSPLFSKVPE